MVNKHIEDSNKNPKRQEDKYKGGNSVPILTFLFLRPYRSWGAGRQGFILIAGKPISHVSRFHRSYPETER